VDFIPLAESALHTRLRTAGSSSTTSTFTVAIQPSEAHDRASIHPKQRAEPIPMVRTSRAASGFRRPASGSCAGHTTLASSFVPSGTTQSEQASQRGRRVQPFQLSVDVVVPGVMSRNAAAAEAVQERVQETGCRARRLLRQAWLMRAIRPAISGATALVPPITC